VTKKHRLRIESRTILSIFTLASILVLAGMSPSAQAQMMVHGGPVCGERTALIDQLKAKHAERPKAMGLTANGSVLEVLTAETGTWSILVTTPQRVTCLIWVGEHWEDIKQQEVDPPS